VHAELRVGKDQKMKRLFLPETGNQAESKKDEKKLDSMFQGILPMFVGVRAPVMETVVPVFS
jgi:hypothetical protein